MRDRLLFPEYMELRPSSFNWSAAMFSFTIRSVLDLENVALQIAAWAPSKSSMRASNCHVLSATPLSPNCPLKATELCPLVCYELFAQSRSLFSLIGDDTLSFFSVGTLGRLISP